ncbi:coiled-coil domain-containing protein 82 isoform X2 [Echinops telfairi]|uniref:Coiled-coil domain-containing protein 82 isoform X2 n=1 Tax=Echinops telfairi TaxID=9371 RepID=A0AC55DPP8_ECHTE|nr:coiled-coil domain-containing protein 82 isoform X2 [Echinops telfairi]
MKTRNSSRAQVPEQKSRIDWKRTKRRTSLFVDSEEEFDSDGEFDPGEELESNESANNNESINNSEELDSDEGLDGIKTAENESKHTLINVDCEGDRSQRLMNTGNPSVCVEDKSQSEHVSMDLPNPERGPTREGDDLSRHPGQLPEEDLEEHIQRGRRKRMCTKVVDSDESDSSDVVVGKRCAKHPRRVMEDEGCSMELDQNSPEKTAAARRKQRLQKLRELSEGRARQSRNSGRDSEASEKESCSSNDKDDDEVEDYESDENSSDYITDGFVVQDEENDSQGEDKQDSFYSFNEPYTHFERVVKALLISAVDDSFLGKLYADPGQSCLQRTWASAQDMLTSLHYLDDHLIQPRLRNLVSRSWSDKYKERVESYSTAAIQDTYPEDRTCHACGLSRHCAYYVQLSGELYDIRTMEIDDFMSHDKQVFIVGRICASRTSIYHQLKHFKFKLYKECCSIAKKEDVEDDQIEETVERVFNQSKENGWIKEY